MIQLNSSQISGRWFLILKNTSPLLYEMTLRGNPLWILCLLITLRVFCVLSLTCHQTEYQIGDECCPLCPPGSRVKTDCTEFRSTSCALCGEGTYLDKPNGKKQCFPCSICDPGSGLKVKQRCSLTSDAICEALEGFFCTESTSGSCSSTKKHTTCEPGQYISRTGSSSSDAECSDCSSGTFSDGSSTSCQPHTQCETLNLQLIEAGTASADVQCGGEKLSPWIIAGIIAGIIVVVLLIVPILRYFFLKRRKSRSGNNHNHSDYRMVKPSQESSSVALQNSNKRSSVEVSTG